METLDLPGWRLEYDRVATAAAYDKVPVSGPESCGCDPCRNWSLTRERLLPSELRALLERFGVPFDKEAEVYHNARLDSGLHSYGGWYHFVGRVISDSLGFVRFGSFSVFFHLKPSLVPEAFADQSVCQLEFDAEVPWLSEVPEAP